MDRPVLTCPMLIMISIDLPQINKHASVIKKVHLYTMYTAYHYQPLNYTVTLNRAEQVDVYSRVS